MIMRLSKVDTYVFFLLHKHIIQMLETGMGIGGLAISISFMCVQMPKSNNLNLYWMGILKVKY